MAAELSTFVKLDSVDGIFVAGNGKLQCTAIRLTDNSLCLFSPVSGIGKRAIESLEQLGHVSFLLAPNHYHNKALRQYVAAFPKANLCAPAYAILRLQKVTGLSFDRLDNLEGRLSNNMSLLEPQGLKTGEVWLRIAETDLIAWLVVDAFSGAAAKKGETFTGSPDFLKTFPVYGVDDKLVYTTWALKQIRSDQPEIMIPCHGSSVRTKDLPKKLEEIIKSAF